MTSTLPLPSSSNLLTTSTINVGSPTLAPAAAAVPVAVKPPTPVATASNKFDPKTLTWSTKDKSSSLELSHGFLRVSYKGPGKYDSDAAAIRTTQPIFPSCGIFFYEVTIINKGRDGYIGIGLCTAGASLSRLPGWEKCSYGYHGDDGQIFKGQGGIAYGPTFTTGDVIGCCLNFIDNTVFYTKNGSRLTVAFRDILNGPVYPTIGLRTPGEVVEANFGASEFKFNIDGVFQEERQAFFSKIESQSLDCATTVDLVMSWLIHCGYGQTALTLLKESGHQHSSQEELDGMADRQKIREQIALGNIDNAIQLINQTYPQLLIKMPNVVFILKCQKFIEMIKTESIDKTMEFGQVELYPYYRERPQDRPLIDAIFSLLAYPEPEKSPVAFLLNVKRREEVMDVLNSAILEYQGQSSMSKLEKIMRHLLLLKDELLEAEASPSAIFMDVAEIIRGPDTTSSSISSGVTKMELEN